MFIAYHDLIYATTDAGGLTILTDAQLQQHATDLDMDRNEFDPCLSGNSKDDRIERDITSGTILGVTGTPTFFVNGEQANRFTVKDVIERKLNEINGG